MRHPFLFTALSLLLAANIMAQSNASASTTVTANLKKGLSISQVGGGLSFGEIVLTGSESTPTIAPSSGASFKVVGHPNKNVTISYSSITLSNNAWVTTIGGGTNDNMTFTPNVEHTGSSSSYASPTGISSGNAYQLVNVSGDGNLYLWVGGQIGIGSSQAHGDYTGTFSVTVAY